MIDGIQVSDLLDTSKTIAKDIFEDRTYVWEVLTDISAFIRKLGPTLNPDEYDMIKEDVWVSKRAHVYESAFIGGPCIIDHEAEVRHCAFIRGNAIVGKKAVVGNSVESISLHAFRDCVNLTRVILPDNLKSIAAYAFYEGRKVALEL